MRVQAFAQTVLQAPLKRRRHRQHAQIVPLVSTLRWSGHRILLSAPIVSQALIRLRARALAPTVRRVLTRQTRGQLHVLFAGLVFTLCLVQQHVRLVTQAPTRYHVGWNHIYIFFNSKNDRCLNLNLLFGYHE